MGLGRRVVRWRAVTEDALSAASRSHWREKSRLDFEDGVDAFGGDVDSGGVGEEQGRRWSWSKMAMSIWRERRRLGGNR